MRYRRMTFLSLATAFSAPAVIASPVRAAQFQYKLATDNTLEHPITVAAAQLAENVLRESNGRLDFKLFPNSVLGGDNAMMEQTRLGSIDLNIASGDIISAVVPAAGLERLGFAFQTTRQGLAAMNGDLGNYIRSELKAHAIIALNGFWEAGFRQITTSTHAIKTADDLNGVKIRIPAAAINADLFKTFGASPVAVDGAQMYSALKTHIADSMEGTYVNLLLFKIFEVQKYLSVTNHQWNGYWAIMNNNSWNALPPDLQAIVQRNAAKAGAAASRNGELFATSCADKLARLGMEVNTADHNSFKSRLNDYYNRWKREFGTTPWSLLEKYVGKLG